MRRAALCGVLVALFAFRAADAGAHYIYSCPGYAHDPVARTYVLPPDCHGDPRTAPATHQWITRRAPVILAADGRGAAAALLRSSLPGTPGRTYLDELVEGVTTADRGPAGTPDSGLNGCTSYGASIGWPIGDHMLNPYRDFGVWSYANTPVLGWQGYMYATTNGRALSSCANAPRVRSTSAAMADEFHARARTAWRDGRRRDAMFNLGIATHVLQDATVPSHAHPEVENGMLNVSARGAPPRKGLDAFPAWANANKERYPAAAGGLYAVPGQSHGVQLARTPSGWVRWMALEAYPYFPWSARWSAIPRSQVKCDVSDFPQECLNASSRLLRRSQRVTAGFVEAFLRGVGAS